MTALFTAHGPWSATGPCAAPLAAGPVGSGLGDLVAGALFLAVFVGGALIAGSRERRNR